MADFPGENFSSAPFVAASLGLIDGAFFLKAATINHYALRAHRTSDNTWQKWVDTSIALTLAPGGAGSYDAASLTVEGLV